LTAFIKQAYIVFAWSKLRYDSVALAAFISSGASFAHEGGMIAVRACLDRLGYGEILTSGPADLNP